MSARAAKPAKAIPGLVLGGEPRVDLLPPEVGMAVKARATKRRLAMLVVLAIAIVAVGYGYAFLRATGSQSQLADAQARSVALLTEQADYAEASRVQTLLATSEQTRLLATSTEVMWADLLGEITARMPAGSGIVEVLAAGRAPWQPILSPNGPLGQPREASLKFIVQSPGQPDTTSLYRRLSEIEGFADASVDLVQEGMGAYRTTITINVGADALANRFVEEVTE